MTLTICREDWTPGLTYELAPQEFAFIPPNFEEPEVPVSPHYPAPPLQIHCCMMVQPDPPPAVVPEPGFGYPLAVALLWAVWRRR